MLTQQQVIAEMRKLSAQWRRDVDAQRAKTGLLDKGEAIAYVECANQLDAKLEAALVAPQAKMVQQQTDGRGSVIYAHPPGCTETSHVAYSIDAEPPERCECGAVSFRSGVHHQ